MRASLQSPPLVGRDEPLEALLDSASSAGRGAGRVALVEGEAGLGKSRWIAEFLDLTRGASPPS